MREYICLQDMNLYKRLDVQKIRTLRDLLAWLWKNPDHIFSAKYNSWVEEKEGKLFKLPLNT